MLKIYNTLTKAKEEFKAIQNKKVGMYNCGPTVYNYAHIGNLRSYVFADILRRTLEVEGFKVNQVINITDVGHLTSDANEGDDKVEKQALKEKKTAIEITEFYTKAFLEDLQKLNIETKGVQFPKATEHIKEQIELIKILEEKGYTYKTSDGIYFDTSRFKDYGKLGKTNITGIQAGARVAINSEKRNITDFALWKFSAPHEKRQQEWESPWGVGFPGWHIECSAMSVKYLGQPFDIHTGGIDHISIHHNNEIAQSEAATGEILANYWMHNEFVNVTGDEKMAKSTGNFVRLATIQEKGYPPLAYRYLLLTVNYRTPLSFSWDALDGASKAYEKLVSFFREIKTYGKINESYAEMFKTHIEDDLDIAGALGIAWKMIKDKKIKDEDKKATLVEFDKVFGLNLGMESEEVFSKKESIPEKILTLVKEREEARSSGDWKKADELREKIKKAGYEVKDTDSGSEISKT